MQSATCPKCRQQMSVMATVCPHCSYDFPETSSDLAPRRGIAYSAVADLALVIGMLATGVSAIGVLVAIVLALLQGKVLYALAAVPLFFMSLAQYVVFQRVADRG